MACGTPLCFFKPVLLIAALAGVGMGGYNLATTGSPLGACNKAEQNTTLTADSSAQPTKSGCGSCPLEGQTEQTMLTSTSSETPAEPGQCSDAMKAACEVMGECPEGMMEHCQTAGDCPMDGAKTQTVANQGEGMDQAECQKACESGSEKPAGPTAEAETTTETASDEG